MPSQSPTYSFSGGAVLPTLPSPSTPQQPVQNGQPQSPYYNPNAALQIPTTPIPSPTPASYVTPNTANLPQPTAPLIQTQYQTSLATSVAQAKTALDTAQKTERDDAVKRIEGLYSRLEEIQADTDPAKRETYAQEQRIIQDQLTAAETASRTLAEDFTTRRRIVGELETLLTDGNNYVQQLRGFGGVSFIRNARVQEAAQLIQARAGVLQATLAGIDGNVSLAHSIINNARTAVEANWNDVVAYNKAVLALAADKELAIDAEDRKFAESKTAEAEANLVQIKKSAELIQEAMLDPMKAQAYARAGVTLLDSPEQIATKLSDYGYKLEVSGTSQTMAEKGYSLLMPGQTVPAGSQVVTVQDSRGNMTAYYGKPASSGSGSAVNNTLIDNERALFGQFRSEPIVKDYNTILSKKLSVEAIVRSGVGGPGDLALVYEFMKGLDPNSVVRETEYATAAQSGNIFAGVFARFNGYLKAEGGFLPPQVQQAFLALVDSKLEVQTQLYENVADEYRRIAQRQGLNPDNVVLGYSNAAPAQTGISKGGMTSREFVEKVLSSQGISYDDIVSQAQRGEIPVLKNATGEIGFIPESEFSSAVYTRI